MKISRILAVAAAAVTVGALGAAVAPAAPASATPEGDNVVINEIYAVGGSAGAPFTNKFVELYNPTSVDIDVTGWSVQYRSATGTGNANGVVTLDGSVPAGGHYLVQGGSNGSNGEALPAPDASGNLNPSGSNGLLFLTTDSAAANPGSGDVAGNVVDLVGYGSANTYEGSAMESLGGTSDQRSAERTDGADTDNNAADFVRSAPTPTNSAGETAGTPGEPEPEPGDAEAYEISEIQGTGMASPLVDANVVTTGVVTAVYATGG
ncbi:MAG: lamin tail domain-containing protein, partial [Pseudoclavibacter sp.]